MHRFTIEPESSWYTNPRTNSRQTGMFVRKSIDAFYHADYSSGGQWRVDGTIENIICTLKNDITPYSFNVLQNTSQLLENILEVDLPLIAQRIRKNNLTVCVIPRAKVNYNANQLLFKRTVSEVVNSLYGFYNGTNYIIRHTDTKTTHLSRGISGGGNGNLPYPGITKDTCVISSQVRGKDILLIDDLYTKSVNIDEDAIQALLDNGANSVVFYSIGKTLQDGHIKATINKGECIKKADEIYLLPEIYKETYSLLKNGNNIEQIASKKGVTPATIVLHITEISKILGSENIESIRPPIAIINKVRTAVSKIGNRDRLRPIFEELGEIVSYNEIRLSLLFI